MLEHFCPGEPRESQSVTFFEAFVTYYLEGEELTVDRWERALGRGSPIPLVAKRRDLDYEDGKFIFKEVDLPPSSSSVSILPGTVHLKVAPQRVEGCNTDNTVSISMVGVEQNLGATVAHLKEKLGQQVGCLEGKDYKITFSPFEVLGKQ